LLFFVLSEVWYCSTLDKTGFKNKNYWIIKFKDEIGNIWTLKEKK
jgi:hypothetical protein